MAIGSGSGPVSIRVKVGKRWFNVEVGDLSRSPVEVTVDGITFQVEVDGLSRQPPPTRSRRPRPQPLEIPDGPDHSSDAPATTSEKVLRSPMPGKVISIMVRPGDSVSAGQEVCVVEAMKMEQSIRTNQNGVVKEIFVQPMDSVRANDPLLELE